MTRDDREGRYDHAREDAAAQARWEADGIYAADLDDDARERAYVLVEFPYPSGDLHIGHWYAFSVPDMYARFLRMQGKNVLFPIGFDAFGLPAENAAIKHGADPAAWTAANIERMRTQLRSMGNSFDWSVELATADAEYYHWTQWLFAKLFEQGLAYRKEAAVKWCPKDLTVLANEQVVGGQCERCGTEVVEKTLTQWFLKITDYAERLIADLEKVAYPDEIKSAQREWIGRSEGAELAFTVRAEDGTDLTEVPVFTTRADTLCGATFLALAPEHPLLGSLLDRASNASAVLAYKEAVGRKTELERLESKEKTGVVIDGVYAENPASLERMAVVVADYVLPQYGTGAVMGVPAHDERDHAFSDAQSLPKKVVVRHDEATPGDCYEGEGTLIASGEFDGMATEDARTAIAKRFGATVVRYRLRDWLVSRQRYWGCPIPIVYDPEGVAHAVPEEHLPWLLPKDVDFTPTGVAPLATSTELRERVERIFGEGWTPEVDTLDTFVDSSWYFARYLAHDSATAFSDMSRMRRWLPVARYSGGGEHTTMHLLYARFFYKALFDLALVPSDEPFASRQNRGLILGPDGAKMSKSKGNVVNPDEHVAEYGADTVRSYLAFLGPYDASGQYPFTLGGIAGMRRFLDRVYALRERLESREETEEERRAIARAVRKVTADIPQMKMNTALAALMSCLNDIGAGEGSVARSAYRTFLTLLAPFAPHLADATWRDIGEEGSIHLAAWPELPEGSEEEAVVAVQLSGKTKGTIALAQTATQEEAEEAARALPGVAEALAEGVLQRVVYVPGRVLNLVIAKN